MDRVVDRGAGEAADFEQVPALRLELRHVLDFLLAHVLEVDDDAIGAGLGDDAVERDDDDAGVAGLLDRAVQRVGRGGVDDDRVVALQDQVLDLRRLGRHFLVGGGEDVRRGDDVVLHRLLGDDVVALQHRLTPGIAGVVVGEGDFHLAGVGVRGPGEQRAGGAQGEHGDVAAHRFPPRIPSRDGSSRSSRLSWSKLRPRREGSPRPARANMSGKLASIGCPSRMVTRMRSHSAGWAPRVSRRSRRLPPRSSQSSRSRRDKSS